MCAFPRTKEVAPVSTFHERVENRKLSHACLGEATLEQMKLKAFSVVPCEGKLHGSK